MYKGNERIGTCILQRKKTDYAQIGNKTNKTSACNILAEKRKNKLFLEDK